MQRLRQDTEVDVLRRSPLVASLSRRQLVQIARLSDDLAAPGGTVLCKEGTRGREFFVISDQAFRSALATDPAIKRKVLVARAPASRAVRWGSHVGLISPTARPSRSRGPSLAA